MQISSTTMLNSAKCARPAVAPNSRPQSRRSVVVAAHQRPHEGIAKVALIAAAAAQLAIANPSYALGDIAGIDSSRDRAEDYKARNAMDAAEKKGPAVQDREIFTLGDPKSASKLQQGKAGQGEVSPTSAYNERDTGDAQNLKTAREAAKTFPTAFSPFDLSSLQINVGTPGSTTAEGGKQIGGGSEKDAFNLSGPGSNQNRAAEIKSLKPNPGKAVEKVADKIKSALPTANVFDPASLQVNVNAGAGGQGGGDSARSKESLKNAGLINGSGSSAASQAPSLGQNPAEGAQNLADKAQSLNPGKALDSVKEKISNALPTSNVFDPASLQVNVASGSSDTERRADSKSSGVVTGLPAPFAGDNAIPIKGVAVPNKDTTQGSRADDQAASKNNRVFPTSSALDARSLQVNVGLFDGVKDAVDNVKDATKVVSAVGTARQAVGSVQDIANGGDVVSKAKVAAGKAQDAGIDGGLVDKLSGMSADLKKQAASIGDVNGGALVKELDNAKEKAPYVQSGPTRATPDILNLGEPGKVIRENASKLAGQVKGTSAPAMWGSNLQVNVGYGAAKGARPSDLEDGLSGAKVKGVAPNDNAMAEKTRKGDAEAVAAEFATGPKTAGAGGGTARKAETSDFRAGANNQSAEEKFGAPTAIAKKLSGQETV